MATARARALHKKLNVKIALGDGRKVYWDDAIFRGNPILVRPEDANQEIAWLADYPGRRPYIDYAATRALAPGGDVKRAARWVWKPDCPPPAPGEIYPDDWEIDIADDFRFHGGAYAVIEPRVKAKASPNKDWGWDRWQDTADRLRKNGVCLVQLGPAGTRILAGVRFVETPGFRAALAFLRQASLYLGPEGGLHHAAAAFGVPAAVVFGGYISPALTGYGFHRNFAAPGPACGMRVPCVHCRAALAAIAPAAVADAALDLLSMRQPRPAPAAAI